MCRFGHDKVADVLVIFRVHGHAALVQKFRRRGHIQRDDGIAAVCVGGAVVCAVFRVIGVERAGVGLHALLLHGGIAVGKVLRRVAGRSGRTRRVIAAGIAVRGAVVAADHRGRQLPRRGRDDKQRKARGQHARPCTAVARSRALFLMHPLEHALGKALRRVELGHFLEHRVHDHQFERYSRQFWQCSTCESTSSFSFSLNSPSTKAESAAAYCSQHFIWRSSPHDYIL